MAYRSVVQSYFQGQNDARQNALLEGRMEREQRLNALAADPNATPEQYIRAGDVQTGAALSGLQGQQAELKQQAFQRAAAIAQRAAGLPDEQTRKGFLQQAIPAYAQDFAALGVDVQKGLPSMLQMPDQELVQNLQKFAAFAQPRAPIQVPAGGSLVDPSTNKPLFTAPNPGQEETARHNRAMEDIGRQNAGKDREPPAGYRWNADHTAQEFVPGGPADPNVGKGKITDTERQTAAYAQRMRESADRITALNYIPTTADMVAFNQLLSGPGMRQSLANKFLSPQAQQYIQSVQDFNRAKLRKESGAAIGKEEVFGDLATFFPVPGDDAKTLAQKAAARETAIQGMISAAGPAYQGKGPKPGTIEDGYRFKGGDPADQQNWEPVK